MKNLVENRNGWIWPKDDTNCWNYMNSHSDLPQRISEFALNRRVCLQAGGNMGFYVKQYAELFDYVYTFEPEPVNFYCLSQNVETSNVYKFQSCLGDDRNLVSLNVKNKNRGKNYVSGVGTIPTLRIDDLNLQVCDLIHLDIEGYEFFAIRGAVETLSRCKPVVAIEYFEKCASRFNYTLDDVDDYFFNLGYKFVYSYDEERIYAHESIYNKIKK